MTTTSRPWLRLVRYLIPQHLRVYAAFWIIVMIVWGLLAGLAAYGVVETRFLFVVYPGPPKWFLFVIGILVAAVELPTYVAHGITRRHACLAALVTFGGTAVVFGLLTLALLGVESVTLDGLGVTPDLSELWRATTAGEVLRLLVVSSVIFLLWAAWGWLVGAGYYRFGPLRGTLFLIPAGIPVVVGEASTSGFGAALPVVSSLDPAASIGLVVAATLAALTGAYLLVRDVPLRKVSG